MVSGLGETLALRMRAEPSPATASPRLEPPPIERVFRDHFDEVYRVVGHLLGPSAPSSDVDDLTQQVFIAAHRALPGFRGDSKVSTWLYAIASNVVLTHLRSWRRRRRLAKALEELAGDGRARSARTPEESLADKQALLQVWSCLLRIKPKKRIVYVLYEIEGLSGAEIAQVLAIPEATVFTRLHHARGELATALAAAERRRK